jgi:hypothetical protein
MGIHVFLNFKKFAKSFKLNCKQALHKSRRAVQVR